MSRRLLAALLLAGVLAYDATGARTAGKDKRHVLVVFDPTILDNDGAIQPLLDALGMRLAQNADNTIIAVWIAGERFGQAGPSRSRTTPFKDKEHELKEVPGQWARWYGSDVRPDLLKAWRAAHADQAVKRPSSCLLTALYSLSDYLSNMIGPAQVEVIVISDFLEVCTHWGSINMERDLATNNAESFERMLTTDDAKEMIHLQKVQKLSIFLESSRHIDTPQKHHTIREAWKRAFKQFGLKPELEVVVR
jgi:hypothetical protein